jgi:hypothetical protein
MQEKSRRYRESERARKGSVRKDELEEYNNSKTKRDQTAKGIRDLPLLSTLHGRPLICGRAVHRAQLRDV